MSKNVFKICLGFVWDAYLIIGWVCCSILATP
jgi:hypothetical protein